MVYDGDVRALEVGDRGAARLAAALQRNEAGASIGA